MNWYSVECYSVPVEGNSVPPPPLPLRRDSSVYIEKKNENVKIQHRINVKSQEVEVVNINNLINHNTINSSSILINKEVSENTNTQNNTKNTDLKLQITRNSSAGDGSTGMLLYLSMSLCIFFLLFIHKSLFFLFFF